MDSLSLLLLALPYLAKNSSAVQITNATIDMFCLRIQRFGSFLMYVKKPLFIYYIIQFKQTFFSRKLDPTMVLNQVLMDPTEPYVV